MTKQELIAYLDAVCKAESAVYASASAVVQIKNQLNAMREPMSPVLTLQPLPPEPEEVTHNANSTWTESIVIGVGIGYVATLCAGGIGQLLTGEDSISGTLIVGVIVSIIASVVMKLWFDRKDIAAMQRKAAEEYQNAVANTERRNASLREEYAHKMDMYNQHVRILTAARQALSKDLAVFQARLSSSTTHLEHLYSKGDIYPGFQNLVAVFTLREYLKMGICTELEGPNGAYAQYMQDVRAARICASIDDLREDVVNAISQLQITLVNEINKVSQTVTRLGENISYTLLQLGQSIHKSQYQYAAEVTAQLAQANEKLSRIQSGTATIAINQYIANRMAGVDAYLN